MPDAHATIRPRPAEQTEPLFTQQIGEQYRIRRRLGDRPGGAERIARFAAHGGAPAKTSAAIEDEVASETALARSALSNDRTVIIDREASFVAWRADFAPGVEGLEAAAPLTRIGKYTVIEMLDLGGQAQVFRVFHPELGKDFVLKLARRPVNVGDESSAGRHRVRQEGRLLAQCDHPNLVRVIDLDIYEGRPFIVMEYVPGLTLEQFVDLHRPSPRRAAQLVADLAKAVIYLHNQGIVHQDIKPRNVLVDARGRPRLIDFGLARVAHAWSADEGDWSSGGTPAFMSPEQALGRADRIGPWTDVFGLGGLLYHLLTGHALYQGTSRPSLHRAAIAAEYVPVRQVNPRVPRALERICHRALALERERRHRTAVELDRALRRFLNRRRVAAKVVAALVLITFAFFSMNRH